MPIISASTYFPPPPARPFPKPHFPLKTATKERPSLELITDFTHETPKMRFQAPQLGALGVTFTAMRAMQFASLVAVIGMCANFINEITTMEQNPPSELIGALTVSVTAVIYVVITYILYYDGMLPILMTCIMDGLLLIASIVVAALVGKPLSKLNCAVLPAAAGEAPAATSTTTYYTTVTYHQPRQNYELTKTLSYFTFVGVDQHTCYEIKAVWGLSIALCVLFAFSSIVCVCLWRRISGSGSGAKDIEG